MNDPSEPSRSYRPGMTVGILGAGQLGRMLALAGYPLGLRFRFFDPAPASPASHLAEQMVADYSDYAALERFAAGLDVVTYEFENVPVAAARGLSQRVPVYPPPQALEAAQDRLAEKTFFRSLGIPTPPFAAVNSLADLQAAVASIGLPAVLKTRRGGYDGKGQFLLRQPADVEAAWTALGGVPLILEGYVEFDRELSIIAVRDREGGIMAYPLVENRHREGILRLSLAPIPPSLQQGGVVEGGHLPLLQQGRVRDSGAILEVDAIGYVAQAMQALNYVGVLAIELFEVGGKLLANEMAPRVHNSGHWTIEGAVTSQFENHLRAILGLPLGATTALGHSAMLNLIGALPDPAAVLAVSGAHLHLYGKQARANRKLGHITLCADNPETLSRRLERLQSLITPLAASIISNFVLK